MRRRTGYRKAINRRNKKHAGIAYVFLVVILFVCCLEFVGCKTLPTPPVTNTHENERDSVRTEYIHDSIYTDRWHTKYIKGDTVYIHDSIYCWNGQYKNIHDSIDNSRIDTIYQQVEVEKQGSAFLQRSGIALWIIIALIILGVVVGIIIKVAK